MFPAAVAEDQCKIKCCVRSISNFQTLFDICYYFFTSISGKYILVDGEKSLKKSVHMVVSFKPKNLQNIPLHKKWNFPLRDFSFFVQCTILSSAKNSRLTSSKMLVYARSFWICSEYVYSENEICWRSSLRSSHQRCSVKKGVLKNFIKFTGEDLCQSLFFNKIADLIIQISVLYNF